jgi:hypothetical protein
MPVLHTYRSKEGFYILAGVNGRIVNYRLSSEGALRLQNNNIADGEKFSWAILLELIRQGDAYTSNANSVDEDLSGWSQLGLIFNIPEHEPTQAESVPLCACGSMEGLHITELTDTQSASLLCYECRVSQRDQIDASVPIYIVNTLPALDHLLERSCLTPDVSVAKYRKLLNSSHAAKWNKKLPSKGKTVQAGLFKEPEKSQQSLF